VIGGSAAGLECRAGLSTVGWASEAASWTSEAASWTSEAASWTSETARWTSEAAVLVHTLGRSERHAGENGHLDGS
jgi:hypothetical protein